MQAPSKRPNGISLAGFCALIDAHGGRAELEGKSTQWVKLNVVIPATAPAKTPFTFLMDGAHVAPATAFISHAYDDEFLGMVDAIAALEAKEGSAAFYYFDLLVSGGAEPPLPPPSLNFMRAYTHTQHARYN